MKPIIAIVGRPNVGKSTLFNRIIGSRKALALDTPGVTRDRHYADAEWGGRTFICVDTGGFPAEKGSLGEAVEEQIQLAIDESDVILCVLDGIENLISEETKIIEQLRRISKPVYYLVNKIDTPAHQARLSDFYELGVQNLFPVSGEHGTQVAELLDQIVSEMPLEATGPMEEVDGARKPRRRVLSPSPSFWRAAKRPVQKDGSCHPAQPRTAGPAPSEEIQIAVVGRPNVGKSSLINALLGSPRTVVDSVPGTTRDVIDSQFHIGEEHFRLLDTAGIRRQSQKGGKLERITVLRSLRAIDRADVCLLVLAADEGVLKQDAHIAGYIEESGRALLVIWNKMDRVGWEDMRAYEKRTRETLRFMPYAPILFTSAEKGEGIGEIPGAARQLYQCFGIKISTSKLNVAFESIVEGHPLPLYKGREVKLYYATQVGTRPPTFVVFTNAPRGILDSYRRYMIRRLREILGLETIPIRIVFRKKK